MKWDLNNYAQQGSDDVIECGNTGGSLVMTQTEALTYITTVNYQRQEKLNQMVKFVLDFEQLLKVQVKEIYNLVSTQLAPSWQVNRISQLTQVIQELLYKVSNIFYKAQGRKNKDDKTHKMDLDTLLGLHGFEKFKMNKKEPIEMNFIVEDSLSEMLDTKWVMTTIQGDTHKSVFTLQAEKKCPNQQVEDSIKTLITKLIVRSKKFYDFDITMDFKIVTKGNFGVLFRMVDAFNYYAVSIDNTTISIIKLQDGNSEILASKNFGTALTLNLWYNLKLIGSKNSFRVYVVREIDINNPQKYIGMPTSEGVEVEDGAFKHGNFGIYVDYLSRIYFDAFVAEPLPCKIAPVDDSDPISKSSLTSRSQEKWKFLMWLL